MEPNTNFSDLCSRTNPMTATTANKTPANSKKGLNGWSTTPNRISDHPLTVKTCGTRSSMYLPIAAVKYCADRKVIRLRIYKGLRKATRRIAHQIMRRFPRNVSGRIKKTPNRKEQQPKGASSEYAAMR